MVVDEDQTVVSEDSIGPMLQVRLTTRALYHDALELAHVIISFQQLSAFAIPVAFGAGVNVTLNSVRVDNKVMNVLEF
jgi:hypothetical protein